jgi:hypothetical protein
MRIGSRRSGSHPACVLAPAANALVAWDAKDDRTFEACLRTLRKLNEKKERKAEWRATPDPTRRSQLLRASFRQAAGEWRARSASRLSNPAS